MKYPEWAPKHLTEYHESRLAMRGLRVVVVPDPENELSALLRTAEGDVPPEDIESVRQKFNRMGPAGLPDEESFLFLEMLITDIRMKEVWRSLDRRVKDTVEFLRFFEACEAGIKKWRGHPKQTGATRRAFYQEIHDTAASLHELMYDAIEFDNYKLNDFMDDDSIEWLRNEMAVSIPIGVIGDNDFVRSCLSVVLPSISSLLRDICMRAEQCQHSESLVKKPNSQNAKIHYFVRSLSGYCQRAYNQPLHEVVAITTSVLFDEVNIDDDYVRKIVRG